MQNSVIISRYMHEDEMDIPGSLMNVKVKFHHRHAGKKVKVVSQSQAPDLDFLIFL